MDPHPAFQRQIIADRHQQLRSQAEAARLRRDAKALRKHKRQSS